MNAIERLPRGSVESSAEIIKTTARLFADAGSPLYAALGARIPEDPKVGCAAQDAVLSDKTVKQE